MDRRVSNDGHTRLSEPSLVSPAEAGRGVDNIKTDPFTDPFTDEQGVGAMPPGRSIRKSAGTGSGNDF